MGNDYEVIIAGGGAAGLTAAAYLSRAGVKTLLLERGKKPGGLVNTFWHEGFAFDGGIRAFENSGIILPMLRQLQIDLQFVKNPVTLGIRDQEIRLEGKESLAAYGDLLRSFFPENRDEIGKILEVIEKVMGHMDVLYGIDNPLFEENLQDPTYLRKTLLPWLGRYQVNIRQARRYNEAVNPYLHRFTANVSLIDMITQHFFKNTPAFFALSYFSQYLDYNYPLGGERGLWQKSSPAILLSMAARSERNLLC